MSRTYSVELQINGLLSGQFADAIRRAQQQINRLGSEAQLANARASKQFRTLEQAGRNLNQIKNQVQQYRALNQQIKQTSQNAIQARQKQRQLLETYNQEQSKLDQMRQNYERLKQVRRENKSSMSADQYKAMGEQLKQARQEIKSQQQTVTNAKQNYNTSGSEVNRLNAQLRQQQQQLQSLRSSLSQAGVSVSQLAQHEARLQAEIDRTNRALERQVQANEARGRISQAGQDVSNAYGNFQNAIDTGKSIMSPFTDAIDNAKAFEFEMSKVKSLTQMRDIRAGNFDKVNASMRELTATAEHLGATTEYTALEVAGLENKLGMSGWSADQIKNYSGVILDLATATATGLESTADKASDLITASGLKVGEQVTIAGKKYDAAAHFMDVYAYATTTANTNSEALFETLKYAAPIASEFGLSVHEMAAASQVVADAGVKGSQAGTGMRMGLLRLVGLPPKAEKQLDALGFSMSDATKAIQETQDALQDLGINTNFDASMTETQKFTAITDQLHEKLSGLSADDRLATISKVFGVNSSTYWAKFFADYEKYKARLAEMDAGIEGWASDTAKVMRDNTKTNEEYFKSAADAAQRSIGQAFLPAFDAAMQGATKAAEAVGKFATEHQTAVQYVGLLAAGLAGLIVVTSGAALAFSAFTFVTTTLGAMRAAIMGLTVVQYAQTAATTVAAGAQWLLNAAMMANPVGLIVAGVLALVAALAYLISTCPGVSAALSAAWNHPQGAVTGFAELVKSKINDAVQYVMDRWNTLKSALAHPIEAVLNFMDHGSVIGGNVTAGETSTPAPSGGGTFGTPQPAQAPAIDTSQTQAQIDALGQSAQATADAQQNIAQVGQGITDFSSSLTQVGEGFTNINTGVQTFNQEATTAGTNLNLVGTNSTQAATELTNLATQAQAASPALQQVQQSATSASAGLNQIGSSASSAASGLSQISSAAGAVASALQSKAAQISSITISAPKVASNAQGGIYKQGAFLTTFAEKSPEAAIPLDNSSRAKDLWTQAGRALGTLPGTPPKPSAPATSKAEEIYKKRVEEVKKRAEKSSTPIVEKNPVSVDKAPENAWSKLSAEEKQIIQRAALESKTTGAMINLPPPTENSSAEYRRRYEQIKKLQEAEKYLPKQTSTIPQTSTPSSARGTIFSSPKPTQKNFPATKNLPTAPNFNPTIPRQSAVANLPKLPKIGGIGQNLPSLGEKITFPPQLENIFSGKITTPQLPKVEGGGGIFSSLLEKIFPGDSAKNSANPVQSPQITVNITIQGSADANTMREAGQVMAVDLKKELDNWWRERDHDFQRASFV